MTISSDKSGKLLIPEGEYFRFEDVFQSASFNEISHEIRLPFSWAEYSSSLIHKVTLLHEYIHFTQATSTVDGLANFINVAGRFLLFFNAVSRQSNLIFPLSKWLELEPGHQDLRAFAELEEKNFLQKRKTRGGSVLRHGEFSVQAECEEWDVVHISYSVEGQGLKRWHVVRKLGNDLVAVPILSLNICEGHAEVLSSDFYGMESELLSKMGHETKEEELRYTTLPGLLSRSFPEFPQSEVMHLLCEHALMTFAPDEAFVRGMVFLKTQSVPRTIQEWNDLRSSLSAEFGFETQSISMILEELNKQEKLFRPHKGNVLIDIFLSRFAAFRDVLSFRDANPMGFFPWKKEISYLEENVFNRLPAPHVQFSDRVVSLGKPTGAGGTAQTMLSAAAHLFGVARGSKAAKCIHFDNVHACTFERSIECSQYPWARRAEHDGQICGMGALGQILGISNSSFEQR